MSYLPSSSGRGTGDCADDRPARLAGLVAAHPDRIELHLLPSYSPEPNPDELVNAGLKRSLPMRSRARGAVGDQARSRSRPVRGPRMPGRGTG
ncbi:transposase [Streptomyces europaeiscabiei]|uniref:transposase n=1 Tax=Streptomyces europaeiscabiei TaxID=146819 RepID=UPI000ADB83D9